MLTFFLAASALLLFDRIRGGNGPEGERIPAGKTVLGVLAVAGIAALALLLRADYTVFAVVAVFLFYELWSCLENWSSENDKPIAKALQRIMVNKAERHLNVPLSDILMPGDKEKEDVEPENNKENG